MWCPCYYLTNTTAARLDSGTDLPLPKVILSTGLVPQLQGASNSNSSILPFDLLVQRMVPEWQAPNSQFAMCLEDALQDPSLQSCVKNTNLYFEWAAHLWPYPKPGPSPHKPCYLYCPEPTATQKPLQLGDDH